MSGKRDGLLGGTAVIDGVFVGEDPGGISYNDRVRLRRIVKAEHRRRFKVECSDRDADKLIDRLGPVVRERLIAEAVNKRGE